MTRNLVLKAQASSRSIIAMASDETAFISYPSTPSFKNFAKDLHRTLVRDGEVTSGTFLGSVKLHGSNITLVFRPRTEVQIQSRNQIITRDSDSQGAVAFLSAIPLELIVDEILRVRNKGRLYSEIYIAGEHCGAKIQKGVALTQLPIFFAIFNIRIDDQWVGDMRKYKSVSLARRNIFNVFDIGPTFEISINDLANKADLAEAEEKMMALTVEVGTECPFAVAVSETLVGRVVRGPGEGIVWTLVGPPSEKLYNYKTKCEKFMTASQTPKPPTAKPTASIMDFVDYACPLDGRRLEQGIEYLVEMHGADPEQLSTRHVGEFIQWVTQDTLKEERSELVTFGVEERDVKKAIAHRAGNWYKSRCRL
ncbi:hypothetical protein C8J56DRAFT_277943 [Mycena floridula]|nr:hypothetical protein C8J56DRAFT_277943 [Mycena floridula]